MDGVEGVYERNEEYRAVSGEEEVAMVPECVTRLRCGLPIWTDPSPGKSESASWTGMEKNVCGTHGEWPEKGSIGIHMKAPETLTSINFENSTPLHISIS
uniref:Uncharacterized protein n=1 Tax=Oryza meridionalis TaxID=40149 RepID=A0A0E0CXW4_9ORYZ